MTPDEYLPHLHRLELAFKAQPPDRLRIFAERLAQKGISGAQMGDAVIACIDSCKGFPSLKEIVAAARPEGVNQPQRDTKIEDALDREEVALRGWLRTSAGHHREGSVQSQLDRLRAFRRRMGYLSKLAPTVEVWPPPPEELPRSEFNPADIIGPDGVNPGFPNALSRAAYAEMDRKCRERWPNDPHHPPNDVQPSSGTISRALTDRAEDQHYYDD